MQEGKGKQAHRRADRVVRPYKGVELIHFPIGIS